MGAVGPDPDMGGEAGARGAGERTKSSGVPRRVRPLDANRGSVLFRPEMPIRAELRPLYPPHWPELSRRVRFERGGGECERRCGRPHGAILKVLPDGRWFDPRAGTWRNRRGRAVRWPDLEELARQRTTRVILAART